MNMQVTAAVPKGEKARGVSKWLAYGSAGVNIPEPFPSNEIYSEWCDRLQRNNTKHVA